MKIHKTYSITPEEAALLASIAAARGVSVSQLIGQLAREESARWAKSDQL